jgi:hypothetical protein
MTRLAKVVATYDYLAGGWLIILPWVFKFNHVFTPTIISVTIGCGIIIYSLFTNYKFGWIRLIPSDIHDLVDILTGVLLCIAPWLFKYQDIVLWPHFLTGLLYLMIVIFTRRDKHRRSLRKNLNEIL